MNKTKLTATALSKFSSSAQPGDKIWDSEIKGYHALRLNKGVSLSYRLFYRNAEGKQRTITLARYPALTADQARKLALEALGRVAKGEDVQQAKADTRQEAKHRELQTLKAYIEGPYTAHQKRKKSGDQTLRMLKSHFKDWLERPMDDLTHKDVTRWHVKKEAEKLHFDTIKRIFGALKTCLNHAVKTHTIKSHQLGKYQLEKPHLTEEELVKSGSARRYLSDDECSALFIGLDKYQEEKRQQRSNSRAHGKAHLPDLSLVPYVDHVKPWILTMFYSGFRSGDVFGLRWEHISLPFRTITKTIEKTAHHQPDPRSFPISLALVTVLEKWHQQNSKPKTGYVFPSNRTSDRMDKTAMRRPWRKVRKHAGLPKDLDMYTLRHNFASQLILSGADLMTVSKLMAHADIQTTVKHYGHLRHDQARNYVDQFADAHTPSSEAIIKPSEDNQNTDAE